VNAARSSTATATTGIDSSRAAAAPSAPGARRGRFAPSPTGPLHLGSLLTATASWLDARARGAEWWVRIEDVDRGRELPGAADDILRTLERFGLTWDGPVLYQSTRADAYEAALERLRAAGLIYPCSCSRSELGEAGGSVYPGYCRTAPRYPQAPLALRLRTAGFAPVTAHDRLQGERTEDVAGVTGDFVLRRRDGYYAYQLAVVVDDAEQGITDVVRGLDLWDNTPRQLLLQRILGLPTPHYAHLPLVVDPHGRKLSKADDAPAADASAAAAVLARVLGLLGYALPAELRAGPPAEQLEWARLQWNIFNLQRLTVLN